MTLRKISSLLLIGSVGWATPSLAQIADLSPRVRGQDSLYATVAMKSGKDRADGAQHVRYLNEKERETYRVIIKQGRVYNSKGENYPDSKNSEPRHIDHINYVMDANGNFYLFDEYSHPEVRHSSLFAGGPVAGAGEIIIKDQTVTYIDADSGHYSSKSLLSQVLQELRDDGVNLP